jgi:transposase
MPYYFCIFAKIFKFTNMARYRIKLTQSEVQQLSSIVKKGSHTTQSYRAAYVLLNCDEGDFSQGKSTNEQIAKILKINMRTIDRIKKRCIEGGVESALERAASTRVYEKKVDGDLEAKIVQLCCSEPPKGFSKWSLRMLADKVVELGYVAELSHVSVHNTLKKTNLSPGKSSLG